MTIWADQGAAPVWPGTGVAVEEGDIILGVDGGLDYVWIAELDFITGVLEPVWDAPSFSMVDGTGSWGLIPIWQDTTDYTSADLTQPTTPNGHSYYARGVGTSGAVEPTWEIAGDDTDDGGTGGTGGELIPADDDDNDTGTGDFTGVVPGSLYVFQVWENPAIDMDAAPIGTLTEIELGSEFRTERNGCGSGQLVINRNSSEAAWLVPDRIVTVHREDDTTAPVFAWILEQTDEVAVTPQEEGGETITWTGRGSLALLERVIIWYRTVLPNGGDLGALPQTDPDGMWHWKHKRSIAILVRQLEEAQYRGTFYGGGRQDCAIPNVYWTFTRYIDSASDPVDNEDADAVKYPVGDNMFGDFLGKLMTLGLLIRAVPVVNGDGHLRIRLDSWVSDPGVGSGITFEKGVNIIGSADKRVDAPQGATDVLVQGDLGDDSNYVYRLVDDDTFRTAIGRRERFLPYQSTPTENLLDKVGARVIAEGKRRHSGPTSLQILEREDEVAFVDYIEWDYVTVDIPGVWDEYEDNLAAIRLVLVENGEWDLTVEFSDQDPRGVRGMIDPCNCASGEEAPPEE